MLIKSAISCLDDRALEYVFLNYEDRREILDDYKEFHNHETVPIILLNNLETGYTQKIGGFSELKEYLENGGM